MTSAPLELVNSVTSRVRNAFKQRRASDESVALGQAKAERDEAADSEGSSDDRPAPARAEEVPAKPASAPTPVRAPEDVPAPDAASDAPEEAPAPDASAPGYFTYGGTTPSA